MTEPRIQYAKTSDGVSIAFSTLWEGMPFVHMPFPYSHLQLMWEMPEFQSWRERLAKGRQFVTYDLQGLGLSDRDATDFSLDARVRDLEAVVDHLSLERFVLFAPMFSGQVGVAYAVRHPERVSHFILWNAVARTTDISGRPQAQALRKLADADWEVFTETMANVAFGWSAGEPARRYAAIIRESITQETLLASMAAGDSDFDVTELLPQVSSPTLVLHSRETQIPSVDAARGLASRIPNARLVLLEGWAAPTLGDSEAVYSAIDEFLRDEVPTTTPDAPGAFRTILFTDVEGSTVLTDRLGDAKARELLREHERITREALKAHDGSEVKTMGDGFMASFGSATKALECSIAIQQAFAERNDSADETIRVRIGLNAGEPIAEDDPGGRGDLFGTAVNMAARIAAKAEAGEILASNVVRELVAGKEFLFSDRGDTELRGFEDEVRLFELSWRHPTADNTPL